MRKPLLGLLLALAAAGAVNAQEPVSANSFAKGTDSSSFAAETYTAAPITLFSSDSGSHSFALASPGSSSAAASAEPAAEPAATPAAHPKYIFGERDDYRWQLAVGFAYFRFQSNLINASMPGFSTSITYFTNDWFGIEGNIVTGFAPTIYDNEHVKYFGGGGGIRIGTRRAAFEPWGHVLVGGGHLQPQTAGNTRTALTVQAGLGVDYRVHARLSFRLEGDYVYSDFFNQTQNNFQGIASVVFHF